RATVAAARRKPAAANLRRTRPARGPSLMQNRAQSSFSFAIHRHVRRSLVFEEPFRIFRRNRYERPRRLRKIEDVAGEVPRAHVGRPETPQTERTLDKLQNTSELV